MKIDSHLPQLFFPTHKPKTTKIQTMKIINLKSNLCQLFAGVTLLTIVQSASAVVLLEDSFATINPSIWTETKTAGGGSFSANGSLLMNTGSLSASQRTVLVSKSSDFNPFVMQEISLTFTGLDIGGTPSVGTTNNNGGGNTFFAFLGNSNGAGGLAPADGTGNYYYPGHSATLAGYLAISIIERVNLANEPFTQLVFDDRGVSTYSTGYALSATPTAFTWTINGIDKTWSISLVGAYFTSTGLSTFSGTFTNFTEAGLDAGSYLATGAMNSTAAVLGATSASLDEVYVTAAIPEPSVLALMSAIGVIWLFRKSRMHV